MLMRTGPLREWDWWARQPLRAAAMAAMPAVHRREREADGMELIAAGRLCGCLHSPAAPRRQPPP
jgi:hypothetical protein